MMKKIFSGFCLFVATPCWAVVTDGSEMLKEDVQNAYETISKRIHEHEFAFKNYDLISKKKALEEKKEEHELALAVLDKFYTDRVDKKFTVAGEDLEFTNEEAQAIVQDEIPPGFYDKTNGSIETYLNIKRELRGNRFNFERDIWNFEQDLLQRLQVLPRYINEIETDSLDLVCEEKSKPKTDCAKMIVREGLEFVCTEEKKKAEALKYDNDCNIDHVRDWNFIDEILFGEKYYKTEAQFGEQTEEFLIEEDVNGEKWQVGDPRQELDNTEEIKTKNKKVTETALYRKDDPSIAAQLDYIKQSLSAQWGHGGLNSKTGLGEVIATRFFEPAFLEPKLDISRPIVPYIIPPKKRLKAEKYEIDRMTQEEVLGVFKGIEAELLDRSRCENIVIPDAGGDGESVQMTVGNCEELRPSDYARTLEAITKTVNLNSHELSGYRTSEILTLMDDHFWTLYLSTERMQKLLTKISQKRVCKSKAECQ